MSVFWDSLVSIAEYWGAVALEFLCLFSRLSSSSKLTK